MDSSIRSEKRYNRSLIIGALVIIIAATLFFRNGGTGDTITSQIDSGVLGIGSTDSSVFIQLSDIVSVDLVSDLNIDSLGADRVFVYKNTDEYIVIYHNDEITVFNSDSIKNTEKALAELMDAISS